DSFRDVIVQHVTKAPPPLRALVPDVPADIEAAVSRALAKEPAARWPDGRAMALTLGEGDTDEEDFAAPRTLSIKGSGVLVGGIWAGSALVALLSRTTQFMPDVVHRGERAAWLAISLVVGLVPTVAVGAIALVERVRGDRWKNIVGRLMVPPRWWNLWWPRRWRRPGDVWDRLPSPVRRARWWYAAAIPLFGALLTLEVIVGDRQSQEIIAPIWMFEGMLAVGVACMGCFAAAFLTLTLWGRSAGLTRLGPFQIGLAPTARLDLWKRRKYAAILLPASGVAALPGRPEPQEPQDYVRAILERAGALTGPARELGSEAVAAARQVVAALETLDAEIALLARDASPGEIAALEQKLAALGDGAGEPASRRELRQMLANQGDLLRRLAEQLEAATRRRERLLDLLRTLWLQVANLRAEAARDALADADVTGRIRAAVAEIGAYTEASATLRIETPS
ncbi:MAG: hypothetical protein AABY85_08470, partial [Gemmatimonadota bacterium]